MTTRQKRRGIFGLVALALLAWASGSWAAEPFPLGTRVEITNAGLYAGKGGVVVGFDADEDKTKVRLDTSAQYGFWFNSEDVDRPSVPSTEIAQLRAMNGVLEQQLAKALTEIQRLKRQSHRHHMLYMRGR
jgi:hypothetical protein